MSATEIIEQMERLPAGEWTRVAEYVVAHGQVHRAPEKTAAQIDFSKWRGRGRLPVGTNADDYLHLIRDGHGS
jgi:hypothetical protein